MKDIIINTAFEFSQKQVIENGIEYCMAPAINTLERLARKEIINIVSDDLKEENIFIMILIIQKIEHES